MTYLLDVNVLIALFDSDHVHNDAVFDWIERRGVTEWATCPITENGLIRIVSNPKYPGKPIAPSMAREYLARAQSGFGTHHYWANDISICDERLFDFAYINSHSRITDSYLLATALAKGGRLATFDARIDTRSVRNASAESLELISID